MKTLILSDIHANLPAFEAVLNDAKNFDNAVFLGDIANFGPFPSECVDLLHSLDPICIMGNHDKIISSDQIEDRSQNDTNRLWDQWAKDRLSQSQINWIKQFRTDCLFDDKILLIHGIYDISYDILPNTPYVDIESAFASCLNKQIEEIWFGHYHYQIDVNINNVYYRCIRPVGHHRDRDIRASYSIYENGRIIHKRVPYDIEKTIYGIKHIDVLRDNGESFVRLLENGFDEIVLYKDIEQMKRNNMKNRL